MAEILPFERKPDSPPDNLITLKPWEFRRADWESAWFIQMLKSQSGKLEKHREDNYRKGHGRVWHLPSHFSLKGGMAHTIQGIYIYRNRESKMREIYYLSGLIDCMINQVNPLLRTDLIRDLYRNVMDLKKSLNVNWYGQIDQVLFPIEDQFYSQTEYNQSLSSARTMKELYQVIRDGSDEMFDILSLEYAFYTPGRGL